MNVLAIRKNLALRHRVQTTRRLSTAMSRSESLLRMKLWRVRKSTHIGGAHSFSNLESIGEYRGKFIEAEKRIMSRSWRNGKRAWKGANCFAPRSCGSSPKGTSLGGSNPPAGIQVLAKCSHFAPFFSFDITP